MSDQTLRKLLDSKDFSHWFLNQTLLARALRRGLQARLGPNSRVEQNGKLVEATPVELPDADEIVNVTIQRVLERHDEGRPSSYVWDGQGTFDQFFGRALRRTMESLRSSERRQHQAKAKRQVTCTDHSIFFATPLPNGREQVAERDDAIALSSYKSALAAAIVENRMSGKATTYLRNLPRYARLKMTATEIAADLGVKPGSIDPYRKRIRGVLKDPGDN